MKLSIRGVTFSYGSREVLKDVSFEVQEGEVFSILGVNGSGKSTLLKCISKVLTPKKGTILINNFDIKEMNSSQLPRYVGYVPQKSNGTYMTVFDTLLLGRKPYIKWEASERDIEIVYKVLKLLGLEEYMWRYTKELSGGELQKVVIGRALVQEPEVLLLDEPTNNLDIKNQLEVMEVIRSISKSEGITSVLVMHDLNLALRYSDKFALLKDGKIYAVGGREIITPENIRSVYGIHVYIEHVKGYPVIVPVI